jgi:predicted nucleic-acid-binding Zn-ribbon protein
LKPIGKRIVIMNKKGRMDMETKKCLKCGGTEFAEGTDYMPINPNLMSMSGANKIYTFCLHCGEVDSIRIENTTIFKKK